MQNKIYAYPMSCSPVHVGDDDDANQSAANQGQYNRIVPMNLRPSIGRVKLDKLPINHFDLKINFL